MLPCQDPGKLKLDRSKKEILKFIMILNGAVLLMCGEFIDAKLVTIIIITKWKTKVSPCTMTYRAGVDNGVVVVVRLQDPVGALGV